MSGNPPSASSRRPFPRQPLHLEDEGGCARLFMALLALFIPFLGIAFSIMYRVMGYRKMANRLLWISVTVLLLQLAFVASLWGILTAQITNLFLNGYSSW